MVVAMTLMLPRRPSDRRVEGSSGRQPRWRLKQVLAKTDTHRQAELVRLLLTSAVLVT
jgi:hypothetical protein